MVWPATVTIGCSPTLLVRCGQPSTKHRATADFTAFARPGEDVLISRNATHEAIVIQGIVVDNVNPGGIPIEEWLQRLGVENLSSVEIRLLSDG